MKNLRLMQQRREASARYRLAKRMKRPIVVEKPAIPEAWDESQRMPSEKVAPWNYCGFVISTMLVCALVRFAQYETAAVLAMWGLFWAIQDAIDRIRAGRGQ